MRFPVAAVAPAILLGACVPVGSVGSSGEEVARIAEPEIASAVILLAGRRYILLEGRGAAVVIDPGIAVTNAHNKNILPANARVIGISREYDLLFFRVQNISRPLAAEPMVAERVIAYGQGNDGSLRKAQGVVRWRVAPVLPQCPKCPEQKAFAFEANAGAGFSGGPVIDSASGKLLGIVFGYNDEENSGIEKLIYAYDMTTVNAELSRLTKTPDSAQAGAR